MLYEENRLHEDRLQPELWPQSNKSFRAADAILPSQYFDLLGRNHAIEGEIKLMLAVLEDAIKCFLRNTHWKSSKGRREFFEAKYWFDGLGHKSSDFSFENICAALGIEPRRLRKRLLTLTIADLPSRRYQTRRRRPLSGLRHRCNARKRQVGNMRGCKTYTRRA
jgi:hypothetical protein